MSRRGIASPERPGAALLYLLQFPVFPSGPLSRFHDFAEQVSRADVTMAGVSYGVRRIVTGLTKVYLIAGPLGTTADAIFSLRVTQLSLDKAWLGAVYAPLQVLLYVHGFSDVGIGLGKLLGFRYLENFRRPFTADSIREFWRRWNVTLVTWLRDYAALPIAGHERPTLRLYLVTMAGFVIVGAWHGAGLQVVPWAVYFGSWLALESIGLGAWLNRAPKALRHVYVLLVVIFGWMLLRGEPDQARCSAMREAMSGCRGAVRRSQRLPDVGRRHRARVRPVLRRSDDRQREPLARVGRHPAVASLLADVRGDRHPALACGERRAPSVRPGCRHEGQPPRGVNIAAGLGRRLGRLMGVGAHRPAPEDGIHRAHSHHQG